MKRFFLSLLGLACATAALAQTPEPGVTEVEYGHVNGRALKLNVLSAAASKPGPAVIFIHGGSWSGGSKNDAGPTPRRLARHGYALFSVDYRLSGEAVFPAQIEDSKCAVRWLRAHASQYGVDPKRIGIWGDSAGGHLAALLGTTGDIKELEGNGGWPEQSSRVQAVADFYGPTDLDPALIPKALPLDHPNHPENPKSAVARLLGGPLSQKLELARKASPARYASKDDCPFLILHGDHDTLVPLQQSQLFNEALHQAGVESTLLVFPGGVHGLKGFQDEYYPEVESFFDRHLGPLR